MPDEKANMFKVRYLSGRHVCRCGRHKREGKCAFLVEICQSVSRFTDYHDREIMGWIDRSQLRAQYVCVAGPLKRDNRPKREKQPGLIRPQRYAEGLNPLWDLNRISDCSEQIPRKRALVGSSGRNLRLGFYMTTGKEVINKHNSGNRRKRDRMYGGVGGRQEQPRLLLDLQIKNE